MHFLAYLKDKKTPKAKGAKNILRSLSPRNHDWGRKTSPFSHTQKRPIHNGLEAYEIVHI